MTFKEFAEPIIGKELIITSALEAEEIHKKFIELRFKIKLETSEDFMPHYRGEQKLGWDILPGIFRLNIKSLDSNTAKEFEHKGITEFESTINNKIGADTFRDLFNKEKHGKDWDLLLQAQHAGVKTTLTDWSAFIISALYFSVEESKSPEIENSDGQLWCYMTPFDTLASHDSFFPEDSFYNLNPFDLERGILINPSSYIHEIEKRIFEYRMYRQKGRFYKSSSKLCAIPLNRQDEFSKYLFNYRIPAEKKKNIRKELEERGVTRQNMYIDENPKYQDLIDEINKVAYSEE